uniref:Putative secreted peptide n=1 Tax=Anopheles braziliensis TaxID=58242 RepID=A0A2M3ZQZ5_9DIPT
MPLLLLLLLLVVLSLFLPLSMLRWTVSDWRWAKSWPSYLSSSLPSLYLTYFELLLRHHLLLSLLTSFDSSRDVPRRVGRDGLKDNNHKIEPKRQSTTDYLPLITPRGSGGVGVF